MGKIKYLLLLCLNLFVVSGVYYYLLNTLHFFSVMAIYQIIALVSICAYLLLFFHHNNEIGKAKMNGREVPAELIQKRRNRLKVLVICFSPFVFTVLADYIYLLLFVK